MIIRVKSSSRAEIISVVPILATSINNSIPLSSDFFRSIEDIAVTVISDYSVFREMKALGLSQKTRDELSNGADRNASVRPSFVGNSMIYFKMPRSLQASVSNRKWPSETLRLTSYGVEPHSGSAFYILQGSMENSDDVENILRLNSDDSIVFESSGQFTLHLCYPVGLPVVGHILERLQSLATFYNIIDSLARRKFVCSNLTLAQVTFKYDTDVEAVINLEANTTLSIQIPPDNPHRRMGAYLSTLLERGKVDFEWFLSTLITTLPILRAFDKIQKRCNNATSCQQNPQPVVYPRSVEWYRLTYASPACTFDIRLKLARSEMMWHVEEKAGKQQLKSRPLALASALTSLYQQRGNGWFGLTSSIASTTQGIEEMLTRLDAAVKSSVDGRPSPILPTDSATSNEHG